jgi:dihydroorotate dehydrogenase
LGRDLVNFLKPTSFRLNCFFLYSVIYENLIKPVLFSFDPETIHHLALDILKTLSRFPALLDYFPASESKSREVFGLQFPNPIGLAAGFDKNGVALPAWAALGFGFVEVGTITALGQPGNPRPRIFRLPEMEGIINRLGFNNEGAEAIASRLEQLRASNRWPAIPIGINIGKTKTVPIEAATADYIESFQRLKNLGDYFVLNVSSPNTPGLRKLQERGVIGELFGAVQQVNNGKPLLVKIAPDLNFFEIDDVLELALEHGLAGIIATNTTIDQRAVPESKRKQGGLSGRPLRDRSLEILSHIRTRSSLPVISVGGIMSAEDAKIRLEAGASLVQIYTGLIYRGTALIRDANRLIAGQM